MASNKQDLAALRNLILDAYTTVSTTDLPEGRSQRTAELLNAALKLANYLLETSKPARAAVALGRRGGSKTAQRGPEYFRKIAGMRKNRAGGRPRKSS